MVLEISDNVKQHTLRRREAYRSGPTVRAVTRVETWMVEDYFSKGEVRGHTIDCDEPGERGGTDKGPAPLEYFLAALAFCLQSFLSSNVALSGLSLDSVRMRVKGYFDPRGGQLEEVANRGFEEIRSDVLIESSEPAERILEVMELSERQCYLLNTLSRATRIHESVFLNGNLIRREEFGAVGPA